MIKIIGKKDERPSILKKMLILFISLIFIFNAFSFPVFGLPNITDNSADNANTGDSFIVNVTVTDEDPIDSVWVEYWFDPDSKTNETMVYAGGNYWLYNAINIPLDSDDDLYYNISAKNATGYWNNLPTKQVTVTDDDPPDINDVEATPQSISQGGNINITCQVSDNIEVDTVKVGITYPDDFFYNMTMNIDSGFYYESTYTMVGSYDYFIWAEDINGNNKISSTYQFTVTASDTPVIDDNSPETTNTGDNFTVNATITDNEDITDAYLEYWFGSGTRTNVSMTNTAGDFWEYDQIDIPTDSTEDLNYNISAKDIYNAWGHLNNQAVTVIDNIFPEYSWISQPTNGTTGDSVIVNLSVTDNIDVTYYKINIDSVEYDMIENGDYFSYQINIAYDNLDNIIYNCSFKDDANNQIHTEEITISVTDNDNPTFNNVIASPTSAKQGEEINITCDVTDNIEIGTVKINITGPEGFTTINTTMNIGSYYYNDEYTIPGSYNFFIWANDTNGNSNQSNIYNFEIEDSIPPEIENVTAKPMIQESGGFVNVTCDITDNIDVNVVKINVTGPEGFESINETMDEGSFYHNQSYSIIGNYSYFIWANDSAGNSNLSDFYYFLIKDTTPVVINEITDFPDPQQAGGYVNITCNVTDNVAVDKIWINISGPVGFVPLNVSLDEGSLYFNESYNYFGTYEYFIWANDTSNNQNMSNIYNFTIIRNPVIYVDDDFDDQTTGWQVTHFDNIQDGVDSVADNGVVYVSPGTYIENILINKTINLIGENRETTIINGGDTDDVLHISSDGVNISGFTIKNSDNLKAGIYIQSEYNFIDGNIISDNWHGISISSTASSYNIIKGNIISNNGYNGIYLESSNFNTISNNKIYENKFGIRLYSSSNDNYLTGNTIENNQERGIYLVQSNNNMIFGNKILNNTKSGVHGGIIFWNSDSNIIYSNNISGNSYYGIYIDIISNNNDVYHNNFFNNFNNAYDNASNSWDDGYPSGGNFWDDYPGLDTNGDGIGDDPYNIMGGNNQDTYPLIVPYFPLHAQFTYSINDKTINFDASTSFCEDGTIEDYYWNFGDTNTGSGKIIEHTYVDYGEYSVSLIVTDEYGRTDEAIEVILVDFRPPEITDNTLDIGTTGDSFSFKAEVTDNIDNGVDSVYVEYWFGSNPHINTSMNTDGPDNYKRTIQIPIDSIEDLSYVISAVDNSDNWNNSGTNTVEINDNDIPEIFNITNTPRKQLPGESINITCNVTDNIDVYEVWVNITYPDDFNESKKMSEGSFYYTDTYSLVGNYSYFILAIDTSNNENTSSTYHFEIRDNNPPDTNDDYYSVDEDTNLNVLEDQGVLNNDSDPDGDGIIAVKLTNPTNGNITEFNEDGSFSYTPNENFTGVDNFTYTANDPFTQSNITTVYITVLPVNDAPLAYDDFYSLDEDTVNFTVNVSLGVLRNDSDIDGDNLTAVFDSGTINGSLLAFNENGSFVYIPKENFSGYDSFTYKAKDSSLESICATVHLTINPVNDPPIAFDDYIRVDVNSSGNKIYVLDNDEDIDNDTLSIDSITNPNNGIANYDNYYVYYSPNTGFTGQDTFTYTIKDEGDEKDTATINITVDENMPPYTPNNPSPENNAEINNNNMDLTWTGGDPNTWDTVRYDVYFGTSSPPQFKKTVYDTYYDPGYLNDDQKYYWRIIAKDNDDNTSAGPTWIFKIISDSGSGNGGNQEPTPPIPPPVIPTNTKPVADASAGEPYSGFVNEELIFDGTSSYDPDENDTITQWLWYFGDGNQGTGEKEGHKYSEPGTYNVTLTVTDNWGAKDDYETIVKITQPNRPPSEPKITGSLSGKKDIMYNYSAVSTDLDNDTLKYIFEWGDGNVNESDYLSSGKPFYINYSWRESGLYTVKVTVRDRKTSTKSEVTVIIDCHIIENFGILIDIDSDGSYDVFRNSTTGMETNVKQNEEGYYIIDCDVDGDIDFAYDAILGSKNSYRPVKTSFEIPLGIIAFVVIVAIFIIFLVLFKTGYIYIEDVSKKKSTNRRKDKKGNKRK